MLKSLYIDERLLTEMKLWWRSFWYLMF